MRTIARRVPSFPLGAARAALVLPLLLGGLSSCIGPADPTSDGSVVVDMSLDFAPDGAVGTLLWNVEFADDGYVPGLPGSSSTYSLTGDPDVSGTLVVDGSTRGMALTLAGLPSRFERSDMAGFEIPSCRDWPGGVYVKNFGLEPADGANPVLGRSGVHVIMGDDYEVIGVGVSLVGVDANDPLPNQTTDFEAGGLSGCVKPRFSDATTVLSVFVTVPEAPPADPPAPVTEPVADDPAEEPAPADDPADEPAPPADPPADEADAPVPPADELAASIEEAAAAVEEAAAAVEEAIAAAVEEAAAAVEETAAAAVVNMGMDFALIGESGILQWTLEFADEDTVPGFPGSPAMYTLTGDPEVSGSLMVDSQARGIALALTGLPARLERSDATGFEVISCAGWPRVHVKNLGLEPGDGAVPGSAFEGSGVHVVMDEDYRMIGVGLSLAGMNAGGLVPGLTTDFEAGGIPACARAALLSDSTTLSVFAAATGAIEAGGGGGVGPADPAPPADPPADPFVPGDLVGGVFTNMGMDLATEGETSTLMWFAEFAGDGQVPGLPGTQSVYTLTGHPEVSGTLTIDGVARNMALVLTNLPSRLDTDGAAGPEVPSCGGWPPVYAQRFGLEPMAEAGTAPGATIGESSVHVVVDGMSGNGVIAVGVALAGVDANELVTGQTTDFDFFGTTGCVMPGFSDGRAALSLFANVPGGSLDAGGGGPDPAPPADPPADGDGPVAGVNLGFAESVDLLMGQVPPPPPTFPLIPEGASGALGLVVQFGVPGGQGPVFPASPAGYTLAGEPGGVSGDMIVDPSGRLMLMLSDLPSQIGPEPGWEPPPEALGAFLAGGSWFETGSPAWELGLVPGVPSCANWPPPQGGILIRSFALESPEGAPASVLDGSRVRVVTYEGDVFAVGATLSGVEAGALVPGETTDFEAGGVSGCLLASTADDGTPTLSVFATFPFPDREAR